MFIYVVLTKYTAIQPNGADTPIAAFTKGPRVINSLILQKQKIKKYNLTSSRIRFSLQYDMLRDCYFTMRKYFIVFTSLSQ